MTDKIVTKVFQYGNEKESSWPSEYGTGEKGVFHIDRDTKQFVEGLPTNPNPIYGTAPIVIFDSMPPTYHESACRVIESRKEWEATDRACGTITFGNKNDATPKFDSTREEKELKADRRRAAKAAIEAYRSNPREVKQKLARRGEEQMKALKQAGLESNLKQVGVKIHE